MITLKGNRPAYEITETGCWEWQGSVNRGYGELVRKVDGVTIRWMAHRFIFTHKVRALDSEEALHHKCKNKRCVNPEHLEILSDSEHAILESTLRRELATHCPAGHPFAEFEIYRPRKEGRFARCCTECDRVKSTIRYRTRRYKEELMRGDEVCALKNILQAILGWTELNRPDRVLQAVRDADNILGKEPLVPWDLKRQVFPLADNHVLTLESGTPREPIKMALESPDGVEVLVMDCHVARNVANLLLSYCDAMGLRPKRD